MFVPQVAQAIVDVYEPQYLKCPSTPEEWEEVAFDFGRLWNFNNIPGAVDGKHVALKAHNKSGSMFYNY